MVESKNNSVSARIRTLVLVLLTAVFIFPILLVVMNSFKSRLYVSTVPFSWPVKEMFVGFENYINGLTTSGFFLAFLRSVWVSVMGVGVIILCTSMAAWYIVRVKDKATKTLYYIFVFSMIVPFQMVMFTLAKTADTLHLTILSALFLYTLVLVQVLPCSCSADLLRAFLLKLKKLQQLTDVIHSRLTSLLFSQC